jgi:putative SOS response-associated peptidase YedK
VQRVRWRSRRQGSPELLPVALLAAMCTRYISPEAGDIERHWHVGHRGAPAWPREVFPRLPGPFVRAVRDAATPQRELVVGQWALVPWFAKSARLPYLTCNARSEELAAKASYRQPWARGQRCIIPALAFYEPCWETGRHVPWRFSRSDGQPWGLAGLWNTWVDPATGEVVESYTMLTINADAHPLMRRMHKPDPQRAAQAQDKRSVVPLEADDWDRWLHAPLADAAGLVRLAPAEQFRAEPQGPGPAADPSGPAGLFEGGPD